MTGKISALIFDFDGTLIDSKKDVFKSLMHAFSVCGVPINPPDTAIIMQKQLPDALQYAAPDLSREKRVSIIEAFKKHYDASEYPNTTLMPGARDLLETCARRSIPCSNVSNKRQFPMLRILNRFNLQYYFTAVYNPDAIDGKKFTKSQLLAYALKEQRLNRRTTAYIGDMEADILAARENGMISIAVTNGYGADAAKATSPDFVVKDLSEMLGIISSGQK
jgi:phosphoglycolate phosphatase